MVERIEGRRIHKASGRSYHVKFNPPKVADQDDVTGQALYQRPDDNKESLVKRMEAYHGQTTPILDYYRKQDKVLSVNAMGQMNTVRQDILKGIYEKY